MKLFLKSPLARKVLGIEVAVLLFVLVPTTLIEIHARQDRLKNENEQSISKSLELISQSLRTPLWNYANKECAGIVQNVVQRSNIHSASVYDSDAKLVARHSDADSNTGKLRQFERRSAEIFYGGKHVGKLEVEFDPSELEHNLFLSLLEPMVRNLIATLFIVGATYFFLRKVVLKRILLLEVEAKKLSQQSFEDAFSSFGDQNSDEIGSLGASLCDARASLAAAFKTIEDKKIELEKINQELETLVAQKTAQVVHNSRLAFLGEMSAGVAHEINNPLTIIDGTTRKLYKYVNDPDLFNQKTAVIEKAVQRIVKIVSGLRKFSRTAATSERQWHSLNSIIVEALALTESKSQRFATPVYFKAAPEMLIYCNDIEIGQVFVNLINNGIDAVKHLHEKWVKIDCYESPSSFVVQVRDSGSGIPTSVAAKLFQPFFTTKATGEGTGLGLSIVKGILDEHGARIRLVNDDKNTCFELIFEKSVEKKSAA